MKTPATPFRIGRPPRATSGRCKTLQYTIRDWAKTTAQNVRFSFCLPPPAVDRSSSETRVPFVRFGSLMIARMQPPVRVIIHTRISYA